MLWTVLVKGVGVEKNWLHGSTAGINVLQLGQAPCQHSVHVAACWNLRLSETHQRFLQRPHTQLVELGKLKTGKRKQKEKCGWVQLWQSQNLVLTRNGLIPFNTEKASRQKSDFTPSRHVCLFSLPHPAAQSRPTTPGRGDPRILTKGCNTHNKFSKNIPLVKPEKERKKEKVSAEKHTSDRATFDTSSNFWSACSLASSACRKQQERDDESLSHPAKTWGGTIVYHCFLPRRKLEHSKYRYYKLFKIFWIFWILQNQKITQNISPFPSSSFPSPSDLSFALKRILRIYPINLILQISAKSCP